MEYTEVLHELSGLLFVVFSVFHVIINWVSLKKHFKKKMFITSFIVVLLFSIGIELIGQGHGKHERAILTKLINAPIDNAFEVLDIDFFEAKELLENKNIIIGDSKSIEEMGMNNRKSPKEIIELIVK